MATGGVDWVVFQKAVQDWVEGGSGLSANKVVWSQQQAPRPEAPAITLRISNISDTSRGWLDYESNILVFNDKTVESVDATANTLTITNHGLLTGDGPIEITSTGTVPGGTLEDTNYWVIKIDANTLKLATSFLDSMQTVPISVDLTSVGTGTITIADTADTLRQGQEVSAIARSFLRVTVELHCHAATGVGMEMAMSLLQRVRTRRFWPSQEAILNTANVGLIDVDRVRAIMGVQDALLFEPRALLDVRFCVPCEEGEYQTIIETVELENLDTGDQFIIPEG